MLIFVGRQAGVVGGGVGGYRKCGNGSGGAAGPKGSRRRVRSGAGGGGVVGEGRGGW